MILWILYVLNTEYCVSQERDSCSLQWDVSSIYRFWDEEEKLLNRNLNIILGKSLPYTFKSRRMFFGEISTPWWSLLLKTRHYKKSYKGWYRIKKRKNSAGKIQINTFEKERRKWNEKDRKSKEIKRFGQNNNSFLSSHSLADSLFSLSSSWKKEKCLDVLQTEWMQWVYPSFKTQNSLRIPNIYCYFERFFKLSSRRRTCFFLLFHSLFILYLFFDCMSQR